MHLYDNTDKMTVKNMMCSLPILRSSEKQIAVVLVLGVVPQFTR